MKRTLLVKDLPWPGVKLSQNGRSHWSAKAALVKAARQEAFVKAKQELMGQPATLKSGTRLNVQLIMEKLGGGGNAATAGAQIKNKTVREVLAELVTSIDQFYES